MSAHHLEQEQLQKKLGGEKFPDRPPTYLSPDEEGIETMEHQRHCNKAQAGSQALLEKLTRYG
tara:strand:- start:8060 stop:8248 length:189 start_codon:yes stop_codon:yes gene_type:complete